MEGFWEHHGLYFSQAHKKSSFAIKYCLFIVCLMSVLSYQNLESNFLHVKKSTFAPCSPKQKTGCTLAPSLAFLMLHRDFYFEGYIKPLFFQHEGLERSIVFVGYCMLEFLRVFR